MSVHVLSVFPIVHMVLCIFLMGNVLLIFWGGERVTANMMKYSTFRAAPRSLLTNGMQ